MAATSLQKISQGSAIKPNYRSTSSTSTQPATKLGGSTRGRASQPQIVLTSLDSTSTSSDSKDSDSARMTEMDAKNMVGGQQGGGSVMGEEIGVEVVMALTSLDSTSTSDDSSSTSNESDSSDSARMTEMGAQNMVGGQQGGRSEEVGESVIMTTQQKIPQQIPILRPHIPRGPGVSQQQSKKTYQVFDCLANWTEQQREHFFQDFPIYKLMYESVTHLAKCSDSEQQDYFNQRYPSLTPKFKQLLLQIAHQQKTKANTTHQELLQGLERGTLIYGVFF